MPDRKADFFDLGGGSLAAAQLVSRIRVRVPEFSVADIYDVPRLGAMAKALGPLLAEDDAVNFRRPEPTPRATQWVQTLLSAPLFILSGIRWLLYLLTAGTILNLFPAFTALPHAPWWVLIVGLLIFATPFGRMAVAAASARLLLAGLQPGDYPRGGTVHLRLWLAEQIAQQVDAVGLAGAPWVSYYARALGAKLGRDVDMHALPPITGMLEVGDRAAIEPEVDLSGYWIDGDLVRIGHVRVGADATVGTRSTLAPGTRIGQRAQIAPGSAVFGRVRADQAWAGSPAVRVGGATSDWPTERPPRRNRWMWAYAVSALVLALLPIASFAIGVFVLALGMRGASSLAAALGAAFLWLIPATLTVGLVFASAVVVLVRLLSIGLRRRHLPRPQPLGLAGLDDRATARLRAHDPLPALLESVHPGMAPDAGSRGRQGRRGIDRAADPVDDPHRGWGVPRRRHHGGVVRDLGRLDAHRRRADRKARVPRQLGDGGGGASGAPRRPGRRPLLCPGQGEGRVVLARLARCAPARASRTRGTTAARTTRPTRLRLARALWELCRVIPVFVTCGIGVLVLFTLAWLLSLVGPVWTLLLSGFVMLAAGALAAGVSVVAKWLIVGPIRAGEQPLWSSFVWRTEVSDTFTEMVAAPWFARSAAGTPALAVWLRALGAKIGRGVWCDSYWLPEPDLVTLGDASTVNRGCVVQTHLFHDRIMSMDTVELEAGATLGPHSVILPAASIGAHATVGPASLVMRGESVPVGSRWSGNPIGPWRAVKVRAYQTTS